MTIDTSERGLETLVFDALIDTGWLPGTPADYDRNHCVDLTQFSAFIQATQPEIAAALSLDSETATRAGSSRD